MSLAAPARDARAVEPDAASASRTVSTPTEQEFAFWSRIARTAAILFAALLAVPFVFGSLRSAGAGARRCIGVLIGVMFFFVQRMLESGARGIRREPGGARLAADRVAGSRGALLIARTR